MPERTVLVVDDDPVIVRLLQVNFEMDGYRVLTAADGIEGVERARAEHPDIILSDIMMPKMDGLELTRRLKGDEGTSAIPIVLLSAKAQLADVEAGTEAGADDYVTKPFDPLELLERVNRILAASRG